MIDRPVIRASRWLGNAGRDSGLTGRRYRRSASPSVGRGMSEINTIAIGRYHEAQDAELRRALRRFVEGMLRDRQDGEDIVQETYVRLYSYRRTRHVSDVGAFCFAVARNLVNDHFRRTRSAPRYVEVDDSIACAQPRAEEILDYRQRVDILIRALKVMPPLRREIFLRRRLDGIPSTVIASDLDMSIAAIDKHCARALADLRAALERRGLTPGAAK